MAIIRRPPTVQQAIKANHLATFRRSELAARDADRLAAALKVEFRRLAAEGKADAAAIAVKKFTDLAARFALEVQALVHLQAEKTLKDVLAALARMMQAQPPPPAVIKAQADRLAPPPDEHEKRRNALFIAGLLGFVAAGVTAAVITPSGRKPIATAVTGAELAINRLVGRVKRQIRFGGQAVVNRATRIAVESAIPVAKPLPVAHLLRPIPFPVPAPAQSPASRGPYPHEPEFIIYPTKTPTPQITPDQPPPTRDPDPIPPTPPVANLLGWQVWSMLLPTTRPKHRHRHRDIFYYNPRPERNEMGMDRCPNPPYESPHDGGVMAWNCVCRIVPIFQEAT